MVTATFTDEQIQACIERYNLKPTSQFTAVQLAIKHLTYVGNKAIKGGGSGSRRNHRSHRYGDCHWAGK